MTWTTVQGPDGVLYFGGDSLISFDGERWQHASINGAYALRGLDFGKDGRLWAAAKGEIGWFDRQPAGHWFFHSLRSKLPTKDARLGEIWHAFAEGDGAVFVTTDKVLRWNGINFKVWSFPGERRLPAMRSGKTIYVHHLPTGLLAMEPDGPRLVIPASVLGRAAVLWMEPRLDGYLLATSHGLFIFANSRLVPFAPEASDIVRSNSLTSAARLPDGRLVLGTYQGGLAILRADGSLDRSLAEKDGLPTKSVFSLFVDRENELWATSNSGIFRLATSSFTTLFDRNTGLPFQPIVEIVRDEGRIKLATGNNVFELEPENGHFHSTESTVLQVMDLQSTPLGLLVAGLEGLKRISNGISTMALSTRQNAFVVRPSQLWPGNMLVSEGHSVDLLRPDGQSRVLVQNLPDFVTSIAEDNQGRLWLGTSTRAILIAIPDTAEPVEAKPTGTAFGLPDITGQGRVVATVDGTVLAFSSSGGWMLDRDGARFVAIDGFPELKINAVSEVAADGTLWVVHPASENRAACVARVASEGDRAVWQPHSVEALWNIGIPESILAEAESNEETVLWIGGTKGLLRNVVARGPVAPTPRPPLLRAMARTAADALQPIGAETLPYSTKAVVFEFAAPEFARRPSLRLETMLDGVDQRWVPADPSSRREFTPLREGRYDFRVRAVAETGVAGPATASHFEIVPPWWRTGTALMCGLLALGPTGYGAYRWRVRTLRLRNAELEAKVRERTAQLAQANAAKTQFVANVSHDIRNPLNGIVGLALALEDSPLNAKQSEAVATLRECTTYLSTLVDDVLDFASIEAGEVELRPGPFSPGELLRSVAAMFRLEATAGGASLEVESDPQLPAACVGDAGRIQQILVNFLTNALKYSGGRIRLTAAVPAGAPKAVEYAVIDEGPGISEEGQLMLFTKFTRLSGPESKSIAGTGLGLASCRLLAGMMKGTVGVHSSPGRGARFYLRLPLEAVPPLSSESAGVTAPAMVLPNCTVLLVEDTDYNALAAAAVLDKFGLACDRAATGAAALELFAEKRHDLVLLDRNLPDMDGTDIARRIRALEADKPRTTMLAVTAYCTSEERALCLGAGMNGFVGKPLTPEKLQRVLADVGRHLLDNASIQDILDASSS